MSGLVLLRKVFFHIKIQPGKWLNAVAVRFKKKIFAKKFLCNDSPHYNILNMSLRTALMDQCIGSCNNKRSLQCRQAVLTCFLKRHYI